MSRSGSDRRKANGLVALSSAAVLAVYSAGFLRTRAAADRLDALQSRVRPGSRVPRGDAQGPALSGPATAQNPAPSSHAREGVITPAPAPSGLAPDSASLEKPGAPAAATPAVRAGNSLQPLSQPVAEAKSEAGNESAVTTQPVPNPPPVIAAAAPQAPAPVAVPAPPAPVAAAPASPAQEPWKDGTFQGWGNARHGSIEATVVIADGRIASAKIEQCSMRYPCYTIDRIVPQVAERGTPEKIDVVSGATESSDVFYWAVKDALSKAK